MAAEAEEMVFSARSLICRLFGAEDPRRVVFAYNATDALNVVIQGLATPGCHVVSSRLEHNSVLRPLEALRLNSGITYDLAPFDKDGFVSPGAIADLIRPETRMVVLTHVSNVLGTIQPVHEVGTVCGERGVPLILDVTQSAGVIPIDMKRMRASALAFTGHKALLGPTGIGGLVLSPDLDVRPTRFGGTGMDSSSLLHTGDYPHRLEAGTINLMGVIGLSAGIRYLTEQGMDRMRQREMKLTQSLRDGLADIDGVKLYCADSLKDHVAVILCNIEGMHPGDFADTLDGDFHIAVRSGLHCAPLAHQDLGTSPDGAVRFSLGPFNTSEDIESALAAVKSIAGLR